MQDNRIGSREIKNEEFKKTEWDRYERWNYLKGYVRYRRTQISERLFGHEYWPAPTHEAGHKLLSIAKTNAFISEKIESCSPFWVGRFGDTEMNAIYQVLKHRIHPEQDERAAAIQRLCESAGFFPNDIELGEAFVDMMLDCCSSIDLQAAWGRYMADYVYKNYQPHTILTGLDQIEPWNAYKSAKTVRPWSSELKGKSVLLIHPFAESIKRQYKENRERLFEKIYSADEILPQFDLTTIKAVQTMAGERDSRFDTWFDALDWMTDECRKKSFDVAIVGCGAYGYPLSARIKEMGKCVIHLGGATQLLFGIIGNRWEREYKYRNFMNDIVNDYWIRPSGDELIRNRSNVEGACYW